jgi:hypothetical protein
MAKETWRLVDFFIDRYYISSNGRIRSALKNGRFRILKPHINRGGYYRIQLSAGRDDKGKKRIKNKLINVLVATAFIPNPENKPEVNHKNSNRLDNRVLNLEWTTKLENQRHAVEHGFAYKKVHKGIRNGRCKITEKQVMEIFQMNGSLSFIGKKYDLGISAVHRIKIGLAWSHVTKKEYQPLRASKTE